MHNFIKIFIFFPSILFSQTYYVKYSENRIISKEALTQYPESLRNEVLKSNYYDLIFTSSQSFYKNSLTTINKENSESTKSEEQEGQNIKVKENTTTIINQAAEKWFYMEALNNLMTFHLFNAGKEWFGKDIPVNWDWEITNETNTINGFLCKKAISKTYTGNFVWFTEDIPINAGPEKFSGLPGLIVYAANRGQEWNATEIVSKKETVKIDVPSLPEKTNTLPEVMDYVKNKMDNIKQGVETKVDGNATITTTTKILKN
jgi:GLPGLI family protein